MTTPDTRATARKYPHHSDAALIQVALMNAERHLNGTAQWFSARNRGAVLYQLQQALEALDRITAAAGEEGT